MIASSVPWALEPLAGAPAALLGTGGLYFSLPKIAALLVLVLPFLYVAPRVQKDARRVRAAPDVWSAVLLIGTSLCLIVWVVVPLYVVGLSLYVIFLLAALLAYVAHRNRQVPAEQKILTREHLGRVFGGQKREPVQVNARLKLYDSYGKIVPPPDAETAPAEEIERFNLAQQLLYDAVWHRASEVDVAPTGAQSRVRQVIDGVVHEREPMDHAHGEAVIDYLKRAAGADPEDRRRPQQGKISVDLANAPVDMDVTTAGTKNGQRLRVRVLQEAIQTQIDRLGMPEDLLRRVREINASDAGLLLVSSAGRNGMSSTLYSLLRDHDAFVKELVTLEAEPEMDLENVTQHAYAAQDKLAGRLNAALRRDPNVLMVDTCENAAAAAVIVEAAAEKMFLLGVRGNDSFSALARWVKVVGDAGAAVRPLHAVLFQALIRKLCPTCKQAYQPDPKLLAKVNLPAEKIESFYRPPTEPLVDEKGNPYTCPTCQGSGYFGRTGVFELLEVTDAVRERIAAGAPLSQIRAAARKNKMLYLQEQALRKVMAGETSIQEVVRVTQKDKDKPSG